MINVKVVEFPKESRDEERKESLLEALAEMKERVEAGELREFVACSLDGSGQAVLHCNTLDLPGGVGLFEIGKNMLINYYDEFEE